MSTSRLEQPPVSPDSSSAACQTSDYQALAQENERLKAYLQQYEQQIKDMESDLNNLR